MRRSGVKRTVGEAIHEAQARYVGASRRGDGPPVARGRVVLREIRAALAFLFEDGKRDARDAQLEQVDASAKGSRAWTALALRLQQHAALAEEYRGELDGLGGFDVGLIDEARALVRGLYSPVVVVPMAELPRGIAELRNRLATLLARRMATIRAAARFVFRASPAIVREATSVYERRRAVAARRAKLQAKARGAGAPAAPADGG